MAPVRLPLSSEITITSAGPPSICARHTPVTAELGPALGCGSKSTAGAHSAPAKKHAYRSHRITCPPVVQLLTLAPPSAAVAKLPPKHMVSTAEEGTITIEPLSLMASYS